MLLLAVDTSGRRGSIALARADQNSADADLEIIETVPLAGGTFSAQLIPQIATLLSSHGFTKHDIGGFVAVSGPGSFTGIRVGLAAVKGLAEVLEKPIAAVSMLEVIAFVSGAQGRIGTALDAGRKEVYTAAYGPSPNGQRAQEEIMSLPRFLAEAKGSTVATPDIAIAEAAAGAGLSVSTLPPITAAVIAALGWRKIRSGETVTPERLEANYIRRTEAENLEKSGS
jgi:tRNA threonylcarbamoyladenosine biosynthesis protein TsaB